jgi:VWFA-related protein
MAAFPVRCWRRATGSSHLRGMTSAYRGFSSSRLRLALVLLAIYSVRSVAHAENKIDRPSVHGQYDPQVLSESFSATPAQAGAPAVAGQSQQETIPAYCARLSHGTEQAAALESVCEFALSLSRKLPNLICDEERIRYQEDELGNDVQKDRITATVRYEDGQEQYTQVTINGKAAQPAALGSSASWSEGEFAQDLLAVFEPKSAAQFKFSKQDVLHSTQVLVFEFRVKKKNNRLRYLRSPSGEISYPGFKGRLWINKSNSHLVRLERKVDDVAADFPIQRADLTIDYGEVDLADGTQFVLPGHAVNLSCPGLSSSHCWHNQLTFNHWHKFAARARILTSKEEPTELAPATPPEVPGPPDIPSVPLSMDLSRGARISVEILKEQIADIKRAQMQSEVAATQPVESGKILPKAAPPPQVPPPATAAAGAPAESPDDRVPVFRSSVRLVLVPTVVRDSQARAVDHLQKTDFRLFDERKPQSITEFSIERSGSLSAVSRDSAAANPAQRDHAAATRHAAYVFDDIHATLDDLIRARDAAKRHLSSLPAGDRAAVVTLSASVVLDFTDDGAKLNDALQRIRPHPLTASGSVGCPDISYEQADLIQNKNDAIALAEATAQTLKCAFGGDSNARIAARQTAQAAAAQVLNSARAESQASFRMLREVVRGISRMPGQRCIVLVSPGFPTAEMQQEAEGIIDDALRAGVIINVLDPSGLSMSNSVQYGTSAGRWDVLVDFASGTGGTFFHNRNDMDEGFQKTALPEILYILGFSPQKLDGKLHKLKVTLQGSEKLSVQARRGYYAMKPGN